MARHREYDFLRRRRMGDKTWYRVMVNGHLMVVLPNWIVADPDPWYQIGAMVK